MTRSTRTQVTITPAPRNSGIPASPQMAQQGDSFSEPVHLVSSTVASVAYDAPNKKMMVWFKGGGVYQYDSVPETTFRDLVGSVSPGKYMHVAVKPAFKAVKVG